jgi:ubiquinone biosynthesis protein UbiJ
MPATAAWLASAEALLNRCIDESTHARALARRLQGTSLQIDVHGITSIRASILGSRLALLPGNDGGAVQTGAAQAGAAQAGADATVSGSLPALIQLANGGAGRQAGAPATAGPPAQIRGDAEIANLYRELFMVARPDPEEELSRWIGDLPARLLSEWGRRALHLARRVHRTAGENIAEYLQEEGRDLVNKTELEEFLRGVDELREMTDRIEARLGRLEQRLKGAA